MKPAYKTSRLMYLRLVNAKINFSQTNKLLSASQDEIPVSDPQTVYSINPGKPKGKVMVQFRFQNSGLRTQNSE